MQRTFEYGVNNRASPATVELIIRERSKGKSLRQLGQMFIRSIATEKLAIENTIVQQIMKE